MLLIYEIATEYTFKWKQINKVNNVITLRTFGNQRKNTAYLVDKYHQSIHSDNLQDNFRSRGHMSHCRGISRKFADSPRHIPQPNILMFIEETQLSSFLLCTMRFMHV